MAGALWLAAVCALCACDIACGDNVYWPGCDATRNTTLKGTRNLKLYNCRVTTIYLKDINRYSDVDELFIESDVENIIAPKFVCKLTSVFVSSQISWTNLPLYWFQTCLELNHLRYKHINISNAPDRLIARAERLLVLELIHGSLNRIPPVFSNKVFSGLRVFNANHNEIPNISDPATFANAKNLYLLTLSFNYIEFLNADLFKPLRVIVEIRLNNNRLKFVPETLFQNKQILTRVDLSHNLIESIAFNAFAGTSIKKVLLNDNRLTHLPVNFISNLHSIKGLQIFSFNGNRWDCACLNKILITMKQLSVDYGKDNFDGAHQECFINVVVQHYNC